MLVGPDAVKLYQHAADHGHSVAQYSADAVALISPGVAWVCYLLGSRKKDKELRFAFYKERVLDPSIAEIEEFFFKYQPKLVDHAKKSAVAGIAAPRWLTKLYREFSGDLYSMKDNLVARIEVYDEEAVRSIELAIEAFDTKVTQTLISGISRDEETVKKVTLKARRDIVRAIYKCDLKMLK